MHRLVGLFVASLLVLVVACSSSDDPASTDPADPETYLGLDIDEAAERADEAGIAWRVVEVDGQPQAVTADFRPDRLNFTVDDGVVTDVSLG